MKIKNLSKWTEDDLSMDLYYPQRQKIRRKKPRRKDLDRLKEDHTNKKTKNK